MLSSLVFSCFRSRWTAAAMAITPAEMFRKLRLQGFARPSSDLAEFRKLFKAANHVVILSGAGISAESGVPTFRGAGGFWRKWQAQDLASPSAFHENPSLVWEFYHYRRVLMSSKSPNKAHDAIAMCEKRFQEEGRHLVVITQNIDELHKRAGSENIIELHGSLFKTECVKCHDVSVNRDNPICEALKGKGGNLQAPGQRMMSPSYFLDY